MLDATTGEGFHLQVEPDRALDAFYHPFAYVAWRESSGDAELVETASSVDDAGA